MDNEYWLNINEYSQYRDISISTIRRYIKNSGVISKFEKGKYYIRVSSEQYNFRMKKKKYSDDYIKLQLDNEELLLNNHRLEEELTEAKMLIKLYENGVMSKSIKIPEIPITQ